MKKILTGLVLGSLLAGLMMPALASAQVAAGPSPCCKLKIDVTDVNAQCVVGAVVGQRVMEAGSGVGQCPDGAVVAAKAVPEWGLCCMINTINSVTSWAFYILMLVSVVFIIIGGFTFVTAGGDPEKAGKGKSYIVYAVIGVVIGMLARIIPALVKFIVA